MDLRSSTLQSLQFGLFTDSTHLEHYQENTTMSSKGFLNMLKSIHSPLSRIAILGLIAFGTIVGSTKISISDSSPYSSRWVPSKHPFVSGEPVRLEKVLKGTGFSTSRRKIYITSILRDEYKDNKDEKKFLVYTLRDKDGVVRYVGSASGLGTPDEVMAGRIGRGHKPIQKYSELVEARIEIVLSNKDDMSAAEDVFYLYFESVEAGGLGGPNGDGEKLLNRTKILSSKPSKIENTRKKIEGFAKRQKDSTRYRQEIEDNSEPLFTPFPKQSTSDSVASQISENGSLPKLLYGFEGNGNTKSAPGGIDLSTLELRYISEDSSPFTDRGLKYAFNATPAAGNKNLNDGRIAAVQASDSFFVWLSLSPDKFWVNLNPNEPDRIIDPQLAKTDAGRILLQSDFLMKKTTAKLTHPDTSLGKQFWQEIEKIGLKICPPVMRKWIVPAPATVREDGNGIYIVNAPLDVRLEVLDEKYSLPDLPGGFSGSCSMPDRSTRAKFEALDRKLILPYIVKAVNNAPEYAELRRVYRSRVAAEWYRQRSANKETAYRDLINKGDITSWTASKNWLPKQVFDQYVNSYRKGEYHVVRTQKWREGNWIYTRKRVYVYGGVDFTRVFFNQLSSTDFQKAWGDLRQVTDKSMKSPVADRHGKIWLGGSTITGRAIWKTVWFYLALGFLALPFLIHCKRLYRRRLQ
jgi:hypothetical protein